MNEKSEETQEENFENEDKEFLRMSESLFADDWNSDEDKIWDNI